MILRVLFISLCFSNLAKAMDEDLSSRQIVTQPNGTYQPRNVFRDRATCFPWEMEQENERRALQREQRALERRALERERIAREREEEGSDDEYSGENFRLAL